MITTKTGAIQIPVMNSSNEYRTALANMQVLCAWITSGALEVWRL